jgi:NAD-dependent deacetylase
LILHILVELCSTRICKIKKIKMVSVFQFPDRLIQILTGAQHVTVLTGAGISAESGVPTFREAQSGLWSRYRPEELATPEAFQRNPRLVWEWYAWRRALVSQAQPNPGHYALVEMERRIARFTLVTQNVDGLHRQAGSQNVIELHGNIQRIKCSREETIIDAWPETVEIPPRCPRCGAPLRPDVVWFGETLPAQALGRAWQAAQVCDVFFSIGTSGVVQPAASLPYLAIQNRIPVIEINPDQTPLSSQATFVLNGPSGLALPALVEAIWG